MIHRDVEKSWICAAWRSIVSTRSAPAVVIKSAQSFAEIGSLAFAFLS